MLFVVLDMSVYVFPELCNVLGSVVVPVLVFIFVLYVSRCILFDVTDCLVCDACLSDFTNSRDLWGQRKLKDPAS